MAVLVTGTASMRQHSDKPAENVNRCAMKLNVTAWCVAWLGSNSVGGWMARMDGCMVDKHRNLFYGENIVFCVLCSGAVVYMYVCAIFDSRWQTKY